MGKKATPYNRNPNWEVHEEFTFGKNTIKQGMLIKFKHDREEYKFIEYVKHLVTGSEWITARSPSGYRSMPIEQLKGIIKGKSKKDS